MALINDCGLMLEPQLGLGFREVVACAAYAESHGYGYFLRSDHLLPTQGDRDRDSPECWVTLGAVAAATKRIKFGPMVSPIGFRNPALLAQMSCNLHAYSRGRFVLGLGAGWYQEEYAAKGLEFPALKDRHDQLIEALKIIRPLTEGKRVTFKGKHYNANTICYPYPQNKLRVVLGGWSRFIRRAANRYADEWNLWNGVPSDFKEIKQQINKNQEKIEISRAGIFFVAESSKKLQRKLMAKSRLLKELNLPTTIDGLRKNEVLCGDVDEFIAQLKEFIKAGVDRFYFDILDPRDKEMIALLTSILKY
jgi:alkanesulfonate monooxygenase SsuD/methylene tetrahydromethanopterin reductase-like flavin-dependent oxidoreductase (luciferase family)